VRVGGDRLGANHEATAETEGVAGGVEHEHHHGAAEGDAGNLLRALGDCE